MIFVEHGGWDGPLYEIGGEGEDFYLEICAGRVCRSSIRDRRGKGGSSIGIGGGSSLRDRWEGALDPGSVRRVEGPLYGLGGEFLAGHRRDKGISIP